MHIKLEFDDAPETILDWLFSRSGGDFTDQIQELRDDMATLNEEIDALQLSKDNLETRLTAAEQREEVTKAKLIELEKMVTDGNPEVAAKVAEIRSALDAAVPRLDALDAGAETPPVDNGGVTVEPEPTPEPVPETPPA